MNYFKHLFPSVKAINILFELDLLVILNARCAAEHEKGNNYKTQGSNFIIANQS